MKIFVIGTPDAPETVQILDAASRHGHEAIGLSIFDMYFEIKDDKFTAYHKEHDLLSADVYLFRGISKSDLSKSNLYNYLVLANYFYDNNKIVIDNKLATKQYIASKISYGKSKAGIPTPNTVQTFGKNMTLKYFKTAKYPIVIKALNGRKGNGIFLAQNEVEARKIMEENEDRSFLFQEYIPSRFDIRVFVVGKKVLGAMRRDAAEDDFRSNIAQGGMASIYDLSKDSRISQLALDACEASNTEIAGVDIMINEDTNKLYVLEVNRSPQFRGFVEATKIDVGEEIVKYIESISEIKS